MKKVLPDKNPKQDRLLGVFPQPDWYRLSDGKWYHISVVNGDIYFDGLLVKKKVVTSDDFLLPDEKGEL